MNFTAEQLQENWNTFLGYIENYIPGERGVKLLEFYKKYEERIILLPASHKKEYHNAFPGGYIDHVNRVIVGALEIYKIWQKMGMDTSTFNMEELVFSAINHDLGKIGSEDHESYIPQTDAWRRDKLGEDYMFNTKVEFASVPDRGLYLLQLNDIKYTFNEMIAIQTHDGLYDEANNKYFKGWMPEQKFRTSLPYILHQADQMAARIEFERQWLPIIAENSKGNVDSKKKPFTLNTNKKSNLSNQNKALKSIKNKNLNSELKNLLDNIEK